MNIQVLFRNLLLTLAAAGLAVWLAHSSSTVHLPLLSLVLGSGLLGFFEPKRGWVWVMLIVALVFAGHFVLQPTATDPDTAEFATYVSPFPALLGGLLGRLSRNVL